MNYTWKVTGIKVLDLPNEPNTIIQTYWTKTGIDDEKNEGVFFGATPFNPDEIDHDSFVSFAQLTEEIVIGWIQAVVVGNYEEHVNAQIQKQIDLKKVKEEVLPWTPVTVGVESTFLEESKTPIESIEGEI
jgi:hypothetical protein